MSVILKFFPEKKRFFEIKDSTMPESLTQSQNIIRLKLIQNNLIVSEIHKGKENFQAITISKDLKSTLESYFTQLLVKTQATEITIIPDKILATFDFDSLLVRDNKLANQLKINYAFTARQVNPFSHKNIQLTNIVTTTEEKINNEKIENSRFIETRNSKKLGPILNDSDILNTEINYTNGNIFSPSLNGFINLKEFAEKSASISLVVLNKTKFDEKSFFRTIFAVMSKSPRRPPGAGTPLLFTRSFSPNATPCGILTSISPSNVCTVYVAPKSASVSLMLRSIIRLLPSLRKTGSGLTWSLTYRSPGAPPAVASPAPVRRIISPSLMPAGTAITISSSRRTTPAPAQIRHFFSGTFPVP
jgi:hypothetical protein